MREPPVLQPIEETYVRYRGGRYTHVAGSDYLRMSWHPSVRDAAKRAIDRYGTGACASRMTTGNLPVYGELERDLARSFGFETACVTSAGYMAPLVAAQALAPDHTELLLDERAHACLRDAALLTRLPLSYFRHRDAEDLRLHLKRLGSKARPLVMVDGLFTHDGEASPLADYLEHVPDRATLLVDDSHGAGVLGRKGRGTTEWCGIPTRGLVVTLTMSKALGCYGGAVLCDRRLRSRILERSSIFTGNTPPAPSSAEAARAALAALAKEGRARRERLFKNVSAVKEAIRGAGGSVGNGPGPMFSVAPSSRQQVERLRRDLLAAGIYPPLIRYPNGPAPEYFRFAMSSEHSARQIDALCRVLAGAAVRDMGDRL